MKTISSLVAIGLLAVVGVTWAANPPASLTMIPPQINYQGRLVTPTNTPYSDATHVIDLTLYPLASAGIKLWSERYSVQTRDGYFSVNLGSSGTGLLPTNSEIWKVMWNFAGNETNNLFMALTVRTDQNGAGIASPLEATPRQQFLTTPFAYRALQSVYARKADVLFDAPQGVQTPVLSTTNSELAVNATMRVPTGNNIYANNLRAHGTTPALKLLSSGGPLYIGVNNGALFQILEYASSIQIGSAYGASFSDGGSDIYLAGKTVDIRGRNSLDLSSTNLTVNSKPMFVRDSVTVAASTASIATVVYHAINADDYDVSVVSWYYSSTSPAIRGVLVSTTSGYVNVYFTATPTAGNITLQLLGIRKGLTQKL